MRQVSILLADAQFLIRVGLKALLSKSEHFTIVGEVANEPDLLAHIKEHQVDVVVLDYNHPNSFSEQTVSKLKSVSPQTNVLVISADNNKDHIFKVLENGVNSFLTKSCDEDEIIDAVRATAKGEKFFCTKVLDYILEKSLGKGEDCSPSPLSPREVEIVCLTASGLSAREIANQLHLSRHTIYTHRKNIMKKLKISTSSELILYAIEHGMVGQKA